MTPEEYMQIAIEEAKKGLGFTSPNPLVGAVLVKDGKIVGKDYHHKYGEFHAERNAILNCKEDLAGASLYVTLEPCQMCAGAIVQSRMKKVVIGSMNPKAGCAGSVLNLLQMAQFNHQVEIERGVLEEECSTMLSGFFRELRDKKKSLRENTQNA